MSTFDIETFAVFVAPNGEEALSRAKSILRRLEGLSDRRHHGARFWLGVQSPSRDLGDERLCELVDQTEDIRELNDSGGPQYRMPIHVELVASDEASARTRFDGLRVWLGATDQRQEPASALSDRFWLCSACTITPSRQLEVTDVIKELLFPHAESWFDPTDNGTPSKADIEAVAKADAYERLVLRTNERVEAVEALQLAAELIARLPQDKYAWKWLLIALHNALQASMVLALQGTWPVRVLKPEDARALLEAASKGDNLAALKEYDLDYFLGLYDKIKKMDYMQQYVNSRAFTPTGTQGQSVKRLNRLRNEFVHFTPKRWSLELHDLPQVVDDCAAVIEFLLMESNNVHWGSDEELAEQARTSLKTIRAGASHVANAHADITSCYLPKAEVERLRLRQLSQSRERSEP